MLARDICSYVFIFLQLEVGSDTNTLELNNQVLSIGAKLIKLNQYHEGIFICEKGRQIVLFYFDDKILKFSLLK